MSHNPHIHTSPDLWWVVPGVLCGMSMPFIHADRYENGSGGLDAFPDELPALWNAGVRAVVCLLNMPAAAAAYEATGFAFHLLPLADGAAPANDEFKAFMDFIAAQRALGHPVAVHCEAGIGRTGTLLAGYLIASGLAAGEAITRVRALRPGAVETMRQQQFLHNLASALGSAAGASAHETN